MVPPQSRSETANAEILGVVLLIAIFAVTAGIISATSFASPQPVKVPAASIEITQPSGVSVHIAHRGGDPLPLEHLIVRWTRADGTSGSTEGTENLRALFQLDGDKMALGNGVSKEILEDWDAVALNWRSDAGETVIAVWDPLSLGLAGSGDPIIPGAQWTPRTQPVPSPLPVPSVEALSAGFTVPSSLTVGESFTFTSTEEKATNYFWDFRDGTTSTQKSLTHAFPRAGTYSVSLTVSNADTSDMVVHQIRVDPGLPDTPLIFRVEPTLGVGPMEVTCTDENKIGQTIWQWTFTDGQTGRVLEQTPKLTEVEGRIYKYVFNNPSLVDDNVCKIDLTVWSPYVSDPIAFETQTVTVAPPLRADFISDITVGISPQPVQFTDTSIGHPQTWSWNFGDGATSTEQNPVHTFTVADPDVEQTFTVTLTVTGWDQTSTLSQDITIWPPAVAAFRADNTDGEAGLKVQFTDLSTGQIDKWHWNFGDGTSSDDPQPEHIYVNPGKFDVTLFVERVAEPHSADRRTLPIYIRVGPGVATDFTVNPETPEGVAEGVETLTTFMFTDISTSTDQINAPVNYWSWDFGDGSPIIEGNDPDIHRYPSHVYATAGTYTVTLTAQNAYRQDTATHDVTVHPRVTASFTSDVTAVPVGDPVTFADTSSGSPTAWAWTFGDGATETVPSPTHTYSAAGTYSVTMTASNAYHSATSITSFTVFDPVTAAITPISTGGPVGMTVTFNDASTGDVDAWSWDFNGDGVEDSTLQNPMATYPDPGDYTVTLAAWNHLRPDLKSPPATATVRVYGPLTASFNAVQLEEPATGAVAFTDTSTGNPYTWSWDFGDGSEIFEGSDLAEYKNPTHPYTDADTYTVTLKVVNPAGTSTTTQAITVT